MGSHGSAVAVPRGQLAVAPQPRPPAVLRRVTAPLRQTPGRLTAMLAAVVVLGLLARWGADRWVRWRAAVRDPHRRLRGLVRAYEGALAERTRPRRRGETLLAYARAVTPPMLHAPSVALAEGLTDAAFGPTTTDLAGLDAALKGLAAAWERPPLRRRLWMRGWAAASPA